MKKSKKIILIVVVLLLVSILVISYLVFKPITKIENFVINKTYSDEAKERFAPNGKIFVGVCKFDLIEPVTYSVFNEEEKTQYVIHQTIQRNSVLSQNWEYDYMSNALGGTRFFNKTFEEVIEFIELNGCDIVREITDNPDIINYQPLSEQEINRNRQRIEQEQAQRQRIENIPIEELRRNYVFPDGTQLTEEQIEAMPPEILNAYDYFVTENLDELARDVELRNKWNDYVTDVLGLE